MFITPVAVRFGECDGLGHVNNVVYYTYMEQAREEIFRIFNPSMKMEAWNLIVASNRCDFLRQVGFAERLEVYTWISRLGHSSFTVEHALANEQNEWVARGQAVLIGYDFNQEKSAPLDVRIREALGAHMEPPNGAPELRN